MRRVALATVILSAVALIAEAQQPIRLSGRVLADDTGDPIANARVTLSPATPGAPVVLTDRDGRFTLTTTSVRVVVTASKSSYSHRELTVASADGALELRLARAAAVEGRVVDEFGEPVVSARVAVERPGNTPRPTVVASAFTDDRGDYRIGSLAAEPVVVGVTTRGDVVRQVIGPNQIAMFPSTKQTYYPGTENVDEAERLSIRAGEDRASIDFVVPAGQHGDFTPLLMSPLENASDPQWTGVIRGRVVSTDGRALARAQVRTTTGFVVPGPRPPGAGPVVFRPVTTTADRDGRFELAGLPAGSFTVAASKEGYSVPGADANDFAANNAGLRVDLADGEVHERADVTLAPWSSLSGRIVDELGEPVQGVSVQLLQVRYQGGRRRLVGAGGATRLTDDLGRYRVFGIAPGRYIVSAAVGDVTGADLPGYTRSYYPGTPIASDAQFVSIGLSAEIPGIDFSLSRARTALISGTLLNAAGEPSTSGSVRLIPGARSSSVTNVSVGARLLRDGRFEFPNVTPGQYVIQVDRGRKNGSTEGEFGTLAVAVDGVDVTNLTLQTSVGSSISGHLTFDTFSGARAPRPNQFVLTPVPTDPDLSPAVPGSADIFDDWRFEIRGVNGPRRLQLERAPGEWMLKEIRVNGIDVTDRPIPFGTANQSLADVEVVLTDRVTSISGTIVDDHTRPAAGAHLIVVPTDRDRWYPASRYLRTAVASDEGIAVMSGLPPGSYYAIAVAKLPTDGNDAWQDPAFLESLLPRASSFTLGDGQRQSLNLKLPSQ